MLLSLYMNNFKGLNNTTLKFEKNQIIHDVTPFAGKDLVFDALNTLKQFALFKYDCEGEIRVSFKINQKIYSYAINSSCKESFFDEQEHCYDEICCYEKHWQVKNFFDKLILYDASHAFLYPSRIFSFNVQHLPRYFAACGFENIYLSKGNIVDLPGVATFLEKTHCKHLIKSYNNLYWPSKTRKGNIKINECLFNHKVNGEAITLTYNEECSGIKQCLNLRPLFINRNKIFIIKNFDTGLHFNLVRYLANNLNGQNQNIILIDRQIEIFKQFDPFLYLVDRYKNKTVFYKKDCSDKMFLAL